MFDFAREQDLLTMGLLIESPLRAKSWSGILFPGLAARSPAKARRTAWIDSKGWITERFWLKRSGPNSQPRTALRI